MDAFFFEAFEEEAALMQQHLPPGIKAGFTKLTIQEYGSENPPAPLISTRVQSIFPQEWAHQLKAIHSRSTGYEHLHRYLRLVGNPPIDCGYLPLYCHRAVAEHALMLWLSLLRRLPKQTAQFAAFKRDGITGRECIRRKLLVVGVGNIGYEVVKLGKAVGMEVLCVDIEKKYPAETYVDIHAGMKQADVVVSAMNLTQENYHYFTEQLLLEAKPGLVFVNVSRGELSPSVTLLKLLRSGHLGGVGMDAFDKEEVLGVAYRSGQASDDPEVQATTALIGLDNVILTPHNAFNTQESTERKAVQSVEQVLHYLEKGHFIWPIPPEDTAALAE